MSNATARTSAPRTVLYADPREVFTARCAARASLYSSADLPLHDAVDVLQESAGTTGLIDRVGQDEVQRIIAAAFAPHQENREHNQCGIDKTEDAYNSLSFTFAWACRLADAEHIVKHKPNRLASWLSERTEYEREIIIGHLRGIA